ncbi:MAG: tyrosine-type recombinase/integrase, partial [Bacteroidia bacterium]|nr:tyrosine-type recombinase/integrase [Bacteroidia bacterium]
LIKLQGFDMRNPFMGIQFEKTEKEPQIITWEEFKALLEKVDEYREDSLQINNKGESRDMYFPWLKQAFRLSIFTGLRRGEIPYLKFVDIILSKDNSLEGGFIRVLDYKVTQIQKKGTKHKYVEINQDLEELIIELGFEDLYNSGNTNMYIIAPDDIWSRKHIKEYLSKCFSFYIKKLELNRNLTFSSLRSTYATNLAKTVGVEMAAVMTGHSGIKIMHDHYLNRMELSSTKNQFKRVFEENSDEQLPKTSSKLNIKKGLKRPFRPPVSVLHRDKNG